MARTIMVTGAGGWLGSRLVRKLSAFKDVRVLGIWHQSGRRLIQDRPDNLAYFRLDLSEALAVNGFFRDHAPEAVIHAAAFITPKNDPESLQKVLASNVAAQANLLANAAARSCFVFCSTISVYDGTRQTRGAFFEDDVPRPVNVYGWSKLCAEELLRITAEDIPGLTGISLRMAGIHGPGRQAGVVHGMITSALKGEPLIVAEPESRFRLLFVDDAASALCLALETPQERPYTCCNVGGKEVFTLKELAQKILALTGSSSELMLSKDGRERNQALDTGKVTREMGFRPQSLDQNLTNFIEYVKKTSA